MWRGTLQTSCVRATNYLYFKQAYTISVKQHCLGATAVCPLCRMHGSELALAEHQNDVLHLCKLCCRFTNCYGCRLKAE